MTVELASDQDEGVMVVPGLRPILSLDESARLIGVPSSTVRRWADLGLVYYTCPRRLSLPPAASSALCRPHHLGMDDDDLFVDYLLFGARTCPRCGRRLLVDQAQRLELVGRRTRRRP